MTNEQKTKLTKYAELKKAIKELETEAEELNAEVLEIIQESGAEEVELSDMGKLSLGKRRTWKYPAEVEAMDKALKEEKKKSEQLGTASYLEKVFLVFKSFKEE